MAKFVHYEQCPRCLERGRDSRGDNLASYSDGSYHCFSCGFHRFPTHYTPRIQKEEIDATRLPSDFSREVPSHATKWLLQYGLPLSYWRPFIGWSEATSRLVFTVGDGPEFSIGRFIPEEGRSFEREQRKWFVWGQSHKTPHIFGSYQTASKIYLVEDLISAHKIGQVAPTICLFGTTVFDACLPILRHIGLHVVMWLDKDQEGTLQKKCNNLSLLTGLPVSYKITTEDPKMQSFNTIKEIVCQK